MCGNVNDVMMLLSLQQRCAAMSMRDDVLSLLQPLAAAEALCRTTCK
jgi:hypothetical protein